MSLAAHLCGGHRCAHIKAARESPHMINISAMIVAIYAKLAQCMNMH